jgi:hypothetical protein
VARTPLSSRVETFLVLSLTQLINFLLLMFHPANVLWGGRVRHVSTEMVGSPGDLTSRDVENLSSVFASTSQVHASNQNLSFSAAAPANLTSTRKTSAEIALLSASL